MMVMVMITSDSSCEIVNVMNASKVKHAGDSSMAQDRAEVSDVVENVT
jgi:hypothetical protein